MEFVVCVKPVPGVMENVRLTPSGDIDDRGVVYDINEWDNYALEAAVQMKEKYGGQVTVISICPEEHKDVIKMCIAKGANRAIMIHDGGLRRADPYIKAKILAKVIKDLKPDLVFTGAQSADEGHAQLGGALAALLGYSFVPLVTKIDYTPEQQVLVVEQELEGGLKMRKEVQLPAVLSVQTGINRPRFASSWKIRMVKDKDIERKTLSDLGLSEDELLRNSMTRVTKFYEAPPARKVEIIEGDPVEASEKLVNILREKGLI
ncbi:electron transfer flavoprotein subunit beta/FixA family protein [Archaeoglobus sp.]